MSRYEPRPRTTMEVLDGGFALYRDHFSELAGLSASIFLPALLVKVMLVYAVTGRLGSQITTDMPTMDILKVSMVTLTCSSIAMSVHAVVQTCAAAQAFCGCSGSPWSLARTVFGRTLGAMTLAGLGICGGMLLLVVPGLWLTLVWAFVSQVAVLEDCSASGALKRSRALSRGRRGKIALLMWVAGLVYTATTLGGQAMLPPSATNVPLIKDVLETAIGVVLGPVSWCIFTVAYFDARVRDDAFDLEAVASRLDALARS